MMTFADRDGGGTHRPHDLRRRRSRRPRPGGRRARARRPTASSPPLLVIGINYAARRHPSSSMTNTISANSSPRPEDEGYDTRSAANSDARWRRSPPAAVAGAARRLVAGISRLDGLSCSTRSSGAIRRSRCWSFRATAISIPPSPRSAARQRLHRKAVRGGAAAAARRPCDRDRALASRGRQPARLGRAGKRSHRQFGCDQWRARDAEARRRDRQPRSSSWGRPGSARRSLPGCCTVEQPRAAAVRHRQRGADDARARRGGLFGVEEGGDLIRPGLLEQAHGGTLFLDEIADMPIATQARILRC